MTEAEWLASENPAGMLRHLTHEARRNGGSASVTSRAVQPSDRKLWLFVAGVERLWWGDMVSRAGRESCARLEAVADGRAHPDFLERVTFSYTMPRRAPECAAECVRVHNSPGDPARWAALLRELFGNPFRPVRLPACDSCQGHGDHLQGWPEPGADACPDCDGTGVDGAWLTPTVLSVARRAYDDQDFAALPILADALEEAGCEDGDILAHCRHATTSTLARALHARGCWALDLVLGKS